MKPMAARLLLHKGAQSDSVDKKLWVLFVVKRSVMFWFSSTISKQRVIPVFRGGKKDVYRREYQAAKRPESIFCNPGGGTVRFLFIFATGKRTFITAG
jgi:hypothetical protein